MKIKLKGLKAMFYKSWIYAFQTKNAAGLQLVLRVYGDYLSFQWIIKNLIVFFRTLDTHGHCMKNEWIEMVSVYCVTPAQGVPHIRDSDGLDKVHWFLRPLMCTNSSTGSLYCDKLGLHVNKMQNTWRILFRFSTHLTVFMQIRLKLNKVKCCMK